MQATLTFRILTIVVTVFIGLIVLMTINTRHDYSAALDNAKTATRHQGQLYAEHAARSFESVDLILRRVVDNIERDITGTPRTPEAIQANLKELVELTPQIRALVTAGADGIESASNTGQGVGTVDLNDRRYFMAHKADPELGLLIGKPLRGRVTGNWFLSITRRINDPDGNFAGVVVAVVSQEYFNDFYQKAEDNENISAALMNADGYIFAFSKAFAPDHTDVAGVSMAASPLFVDHVNGKPSTTYEGRIFKDDTKRIVSFQRVPDRPVIIVTSLTRERAFAASSSHMKVVIVIIAVTGAVLLYLLISTIRQVRHREIVELKLRHMANHDLLTNLPNRRQGIEYLTRAMAGGRRHVTQVGVLFIDLDGFKTINDRYGHQAGDEVLIETAKRFLACVRDTDVVARLGGDEFLIVLSDITDETATLRVAELILEAASQPYQFGADEATLSASVGIAFYPHHTDNPDDLIKMADNAMYQAKEAGKNNYRIADQ